MGRIGFQGCSVTLLGFRGAPEHLQHQSAVREGSGARRARSAIEHLVEERERPCRIAAQRERGRGGGANPGGDSLTARLQNAIEERRRRGRITPPEARLRQPAGGAQRGAVEWLSGAGDQRSEHPGSGGGISGQQLEPPLTDLERRIPRVPERSRPQNAMGFDNVVAVEQQSQQFHPVAATLRGRGSPGPALVPVLDCGKQQSAAPRPLPVPLMAGEETPALGNPVGIRILSKHLAQPEPGGGILRQLRHGPPQPDDGFLAPPEKCETATVFVGGPGGGMFGGGCRFEEGQGSLVVVFGEPQFPAFERPCRRLAGGGRAEEPPRLRHETGFAELRGEFPAGLLGNFPIEGQQVGENVARFFVPAQHGEQPDPKRKRLGVTRTTIERCDRRRIVEQPDVRLGAKPEQGRMRSPRAGGVQNPQHRGEVFPFQQTAGLRQHPGIGLEDRAASPEEEDERQRRHGRRFLARWPDYGVTVRETASSSPRNSSFEWKNQLRFAGSRSPPLSISPSRWMNSPSLADSSW